MPRLSSAARATAPSINAIVPWYGSKRGMATDIAHQLGPHRVYWEPFCGSMAVLLAKPECSAETVNDLHGDLVNLALVIQHSQLAPRFYRRLRRTWLCEELFNKARVLFEALKLPAAAAPDEERAYWFFLFAWMGRNGTIGSTGGTNFCVRYTAGGGASAARWRNAVDSIPSWQRRMRNVTILNSNGLKICERIDDAEGTAIYADPPYLVKHEPYVHDFTSADHKRLAAALCRFKRARVVVSYYAHPALADLYPGWHQLDCTRTKNTAQANKRGRNGKTAAPEVLILNGPPVLTAAQEGRLF